MEVSYRKCKSCKQPIEICHNHIRGVVCYKKSYYHTACFCELAEKNSKNTRGKPADWKNALENIAELEKETMQILRQHWGDREAKYALNDYLLSQYNVVTISDKRFWQTVADLSNGIYKKKRCKKISTQTLLDVWKWYQQELDEINRYNKANSSGPTDDGQRIKYDLAIVVRNIPDFLAYQEKQKSAEIERQMHSKENINIDYSKIKAASNNSGLGDISSLLDDLI